MLDRAGHGCGKATLADQLRRRRFKAPLQQHIQKQKKDPCVTRQFLAPAARPMERAGTCNTSAQQNGKHDESFPEMVGILSGKFYFGNLVYSSNYPCPTLSAFIPNEKHGRYNKCESATVACVFNYLGNTQTIHRVERTAGNTESAWRG